MTDERLAEIEAREKVATHGPWNYSGVPYNLYEDPTIFGPNDEYIAQTVYDMQSGSQNHNIDEDTIFIAHARQDVPDLIAEVRRLQDELRLEKSITESESRWAKHYFDERNALQEHLQEVVSRIAELSSPTIIFQVTPEEMERVKERLSQND